MIDKRKENPPDGKEPNTCRTQMNHVPESLSRPAKQRLKWMKHFNKYRNARLTCRHFGISPDTFYLWKKRFVPENLKTLEDDFRTRKPHKIRVSKRKTALFETIIKLKNINPSLGKSRITKILKEAGYEISSSTVGRMLKHY